MQILEVIYENFWLFFFLVLFIVIIVVNTASSAKTKKEIEENECKLADYIKSDKSGYIDAVVKERALELYVREDYSYRKEHGRFICGLYETLDIETRFVSETDVIYTINYKHRAHKYLGKKELYPPCSGIFKARDKYLSQLPIACIGKIYPCEEKDAELLMNRLDEIDREQGAEDIRIRTQKLEQQKEEEERKKIEQRIIERERKRNLEKVITQELIEEGRIFPDANRRPPIHKDIVRAVWHRDGGVCAYCGSNEKLHLDHIIPFSKGGATCVGNLQLLCEKCNIQKSNKI